MAAGDTVLLTDTGLLAAAPLFGIVVDAGPPEKILWETGYESVNVASRGTGALRIETVTDADPADAALYLLRTVQSTVVNYGQRGEGVVTHVLKLSGVSKVIIRTAEGFYSILAISTIALVPNN